MADARDDKRLAKWIASQRAKAMEMQVAEDARRKLREEQEIREEAQRLIDAIKDFPDEVKPYCTKRTSVSGAIVELPGLPAFNAWVTNGGGFGFDIPYVCVGGDDKPYFTALTESERLYGEWWAALEKLISRQLEFDAAKKQEQVAAEQ